MNSKNSPNPILPTQAPTLSRFIYINTALARLSDFASQKVERIVPAPQFHQQKVERIVPDPQFHPTTQPDAFGSSPPRATFANQLHSNQHWMEAPPSIWKESFKIFHNLPNQVRL